MFVTYGPVALNLIDVHEFRREAYFIGRNYAYTKYTISLRAWLNPGTQLDAFPGAPSITDAGDFGLPLVPPAVPLARQFPNGSPTFTKAGGPGGGPGGTGRVPPISSDRALRHILMQPRLQLQLSQLGAVSIQCPLPGFPCDAMGGPIPIHCNVVEITPRTWIVEWAVECCINECPFFNTVGLVPIVLAQSWHMRHELDANYFTTRIVEGQVLFRMDALQLALSVPDDFRGQLLMPQPLGYKRERIEVEATEQPNLLKFRLVDRQVPFGWTNQYVTQLKAHHRIHTTKETLGHALASGIGPNIENLASSGFGAAGSGLLLGADLIGAAIPSFLEPLFAAGSLPLGWQFLKDAGKFAFVAGKTAFDTISTALPVSYHTVDVEVFGNPISTRAALETYARQIVSARLSSFFVFAAPAILANRAAGAAPNVVQNAANAANAALDILQPLGGILGAAAAGAKRWIDPAAAMVSNVVSPTLNVAAGALTALVPYGVDTLIDHDIAGKWIHLQHTCISGPIGTVFSGASAVINVSPMPDMEDTALQPGTISGLAGPPLPLITGGISPPGPPTNSGTRGTDWSVVLSAALQAPDSLPPDLGTAPRNSAAAVNPLLPLTI